MSFKRFVIVVLDSLGVGALPDAEKFGDAGAHTLKHTDQGMKGLKIPNLQAMGLLNLSDQPNRGVAQTRAYFSRMMEKSNGKDTTTGHWEMMSLPLEQAMSHFPKGFPPDFMQNWQKETGLGFLGNKPASGTVIIDELGDEHLKTGNPIIYTSADSVFQIAAHEEKFGLERLYKLCEESRKLLDASAFKVGRVIARPFVGMPGSFKRTKNRKDFSIMPPAKTVLDQMKEAGLSVVGVGKIPSIFSYQGITKILEAHNDEEALEATLKALDEEKSAGLIFTNFNDLDMLYGHRRDLPGYGRQLEWIDQGLSKILEKLTNDDCLVITADHGNDPSYKGSDHTREFVPLIIDSPRFQKAATTQKRLIDRNTFSDLGQSLCDNFKISKAKYGESFLSLLA